VLIHQPLGGAKGLASDILIAAKEIEKTREELCSIIASHSGQPHDKVFADMDRDYWLTSEEALQYGMTDRILGKQHHDWASSGCDVNSKIRESLA